MNTEQFDQNMAQFEAKLLELTARMDKWEQTYMNRLQQPDSGSSELPKDYSHLLPEGYEFCAEEMAENWVKVKNPTEANRLGHIWQLDKRPHLALIDEYRPIRKIQTPPDPKQDLFNLLSEEFGVVALESDMREIIDAVRKVLNNPKDNPYQVDWTKAPDWADVHCWDASNFGYWYGTIEGRSSWIPNLQLSGYNLAAGLDWELSKTFRPQ